MFCLFFKMYYTNQIMRKRKEHTLSTTFTLSSYHNIFTVVGDNPTN